MWDIFLKLNPAFRTRYFFGFGCGGKAASHGRKIFLSTFFFFS
jgi:hypothetical protein